MHLPLVGLAVPRVSEDTIPVVVANDDGAIVPAGAGPNHLRRRIGLHTVNGDGVAVSVAKLERAVGEPIVDRIRLLAPETAIAARKLMHKKPFVDRRYVSYVGHTRPVRVPRIGHIIDDRAPVYHVCGLLVSELLSVQRVPLVGVKDTKSVIKVPAATVNPLLSGTLEKGRRI